MAARPKETPPGKEKRGISPTFARHNDPKQRKSPNASPSRPGLTDHKHDSTSSEKPIPNYLRPTISSTGYDHSAHHIKKQGSACDTVHKSSLTRKRSFDRPLPPHTSKDRNILRSSLSFASKSTTHASQKVHPNRLAKVPQDSGKKQSLCTKVVTVQKSSNGTKKQDSGNSFETTKAYVVESSSSVNKSDITDIQESQEEDPQAIVVTDEEVMTNIEDNYERPSENVLVEDKEHIDPQQVTPTIKEKVAKSAPVHEELKIKESSEGVSNQDTSGSCTMKEANINNLESEQGIASNDSVDSVNESHAGEPQVENQEKVSGEDAIGEALDEKEEAKNEGLIANSMDEKEEAANESQVVNSKEAEEVENGAKEEKQETVEPVQVSQADHHQEADNVAENRPPPVQSKKESAVSNDVIEETASKLRDQRRNKVKALAGAFESVMSFKEPKS